MQSILETSEVASLLNAWGYLPTDSPTEDELAGAVIDFQAFNGIQADGVVGPETAMLLRNPYRCALPDMMVEKNRLCRWSHSRVTVGLVDGFQLPGLTRSQAEGALHDAMESWNRVCGISLQFAQQGEHVNIVIRSDKMDGRGGTLAESYLPCGNYGPNSQLGQRYDTGEGWTAKMLQAVGAHELGHAKGISHLPSGNLLAPYYNPKVIVPQKGDIAEAVKRYGEPKVTPPPTTPPDDSMSVQIVIPATGKVYSGTLVARSGR